MSNMTANVFIAGPLDVLVARMFKDMKGYKGTRDISEADIVVFTGGEDVDPCLYGERPLKTTFFNPIRDAVEVDAFTQAVYNEKFMVGICRGAQFLNVMNGGKLWQHVDNHLGDHLIRDEITGRDIKVTSTHHQMMRPAENGEIVATAAKSTIKQYGASITPPGQSRHYPEGQWTGKTCVEDPDVEVVYYPETYSLCFQPHPEYDSLTTLEYFEELMLRYYWSHFLDNRLAQRTA